MWSVIKTMFYTLLWWFLARISFLHKRLPFRNKTFIILSSGRSGSTLLVRLLNSHLRIKCHDELLNRDQLLAYDISRNTSPNTLVNYVKANLLSISRHYLFVGFKVFNEQLEYCNLPLKSLLESLDYPHVIILYRENLLDTYTSLKIAEKNNIWFSESVVNNCAIEVDWESLKDYCDTEKERWKSSLSHLKQCKLISISFQQLITNKERTMEKVFEFLNLPLEPVYTCSVRQNPLPLEDKVSNFKEIMKRAEDEDYSLMLTSEWLKEHIY